MLNGFNRNINIFKKTIQFFARSISLTASKTAHTEHHHTRERHEPSMESDFSEACKRLFVDVAAWDPYMGSEGDEFQLCLQLLPEQERTAVMRYAREDDKKRMLVSRLLQRHCISSTLGTRWTNIVIKRTKGQKPFVAEHSGKFPNFNYNVSHDGTSVCCCC